MKSPNLQKITIDGCVRDTPVAKRYEAYGDEHGIPVVHADGVADTIHAGHTLSSGKKEVLVTAHTGAAVKQCTGLEDEYVCCNLHVMNQTTNCPLDCSYCILQAYINRPLTTVHANLGAMMAQIERESASQPNRLFRVGTGDLGDALALDPLGGVAHELVPRYAALPNVVLELKTKSDAVDQLVGLEHRGRVVVAWSINTPHIIDTEEHRAASLEHRLEAARKVVDAGYPVAFHFDPMVVHDGWEEAYPETLRQILAAVPAERIAWISMGALRFPPAMLKSMQQRFPNSRLPLGELILANDGKMRYLKPMRVALFKALHEALAASPAADVFSYLCMEASDVWRRVYGDSPADNHDLDFRFATSVVRRFPHLMPEPPSRLHYEKVKNLNGSRTEASP